LGEETITLYEAIGGAPTLLALTARFYQLMDTLPEAARCRAIHPTSLEGSREKFYEYLTGYLGGPPLYTDKRGHPRLRTIFPQPSARPSATNGCCASAAPSTRRSPTRNCGRSSGNRSSALPITCRTRNSI
jgi:hypothetical protein